MMRLRSTLGSLQKAMDVLVPPGRPLPGPDLLPIQLVGDLPQRLAALPEPLNPLQDGLLARLGLHVAFVSGLAVAVRRIADRIPASPSCAASRPASALRWLPAPTG